MRERGPHFAPLYTLRSSLLSAEGIDQNSQHGNKSQFVGAFAELRKATTSFVVSALLFIRPHAVTRLSQDGFL
jgi:hypothetical protein